jgi:hypothetical protein
MEIPVKEVYTTFKLMLFHADQCNHSHKILIPWNEVKQNQKVLTRKNSSFLEQGRKNGKETIQRINFIYACELIEYDISNKEVFEKYGVTKIPTILIESKDNEVEEFIYYSDHKKDLFIDNLVNFIKLFQDNYREEKSTIAKHPLKNKVLGFPTGPSIWKYDSTGKIINLGLTGPSGPPKESLVENIERIKKVNELNNGLVEKVKELTIKLADNFNEIIEAGIRPPSISGEFDSLDKEINL